MGSWNTARNEYLCAGIDEIRLYGLFRLDWKLLKGEKSFRTGVDCLAWFVFANILSFELQWAYSGHISCSSSLALQDFDIVSDKKLGVIWIYCLLSDFHEVVSLFFMFFCQLVQLNPLVFGYILLIDYFWLFIWTRLFMLYYFWRFVFLYADAVFILYWRLIWWRLFFHILFFRLWLKKKFRFLLLDRLLLNSRSIWKAIMDIDIGDILQAHTQLLILSWFSFTF